MQRREFLGQAGGLVAAGLLSGLGGCTSAPPLKVASHVWPGFEFMVLALKQGWVSPSAAQLVETQTASESLRLIVEGAVDAAALTLDETLAGLQQGAPLSVILLFDVSAGADVLLGRPAISRLEQIKDKRVAVEISALGKLMLSKVLQRAGLRQEQVRVLNIAEQDHFETWQNGDVDAIITYEPTATRIEKSGAVRLFDSIEIPDTIFDVLALRRDRVQGQQEHLIALTRGHFMALQAWKNNPVDTSFRLSRRLNTPGQQVPALFRGLELPDLDYNRHLLGGGAERMLTISREIAGIVGVAPSLIDAGLFDASYLG